MQTASDVAGFAYVKVVWNKCPDLRERLVQSGAEKSRCGSAGNMEMRAGRFTEPARIS